jgi:Mlc titration factor MtfA (ptsG expression regulator)
MFGWLKRRRRERILTEPFPGAWRGALDRDVALWRTLSEDERTRIEADVRIFVAERTWEPCGGMDLTPERKAIIAMLACLLTLGRSVDAFDHVRTILVYPERYLAPEAEEDEFGVVTEVVDDREGEAWERGQVVLSWADVRQDARRLDGRNLVLHEFAHQVDLLDFLRATRPATPEDRERHARWKRVLLDSYDLLCGLDDEGRRDPVLDTYGAEDEAECFAVATEAFFERPSRLKKFHPELYEVLSEYYRQDPAVRMELESWGAGELEREKNHPGSKPKGLGKKGKSKFKWKG